MAQTRGMDLNCRRGGRSWRPLSPGMGCQPSRVRLGGKSANGSCALPSSASGPHWACQACAVDLEMQRHTPPGGDLKCPILPVCPAMQEVDTCAVRPETGVAIILCIS